ncbi:hypothetical protein BRW84_07120 [Oxalobacter formigenes OXCC13]|nr:hypothetical protein BRW84_07120 [Oxalobacter formigenes OXCC13]
MVFFPVLWRFFRFGKEYGQYNREWQDFFLIFIPSMAFYSSISIIKLKSVLFFYGRQSGNGGPEALVVGPVRQIG